MSAAIIQLASHVLFPNFATRAAGDQAKLKKSIAVGKRLERAAQLLPRIDLRKTAYYAVHDVGGLKTIGRRAATVMIINQLISEGIDLLPLGFVRLGWLPMLSFNALWLVFAMMAALMTAKAMTMIPGNQAFEQRYEYIATVRHFLGQETARTVEVLFYVTAMSQMLSFLDLVELLDTLVLQPLLGLRLYFCWNWGNPLASVFGVARVLPSASSMSLFGRMEFAPWISAFHRISVSDQGSTGTASNAAVNTCGSQITIGYVLVAVTFIYLGRLNLDDSQVLNNLAFVSSMGIWVILVGAGGAKIGSAALTAQGFGRRTWNLFRRRTQGYLRGCRVSPAGRLVRPSISRGTLRFNKIWLSLLYWLQPLRLDSLAMHHLRSTSSATSGAVDELQQTLGVYLNVPGVTAVELNYELLEWLTGENDLGRLMQSVVNTYALDNTCGTCWDDLCFEAAAASHLLVTPDPLWAGHVRDVRVSYYVIEQFRDVNKAMPSMPPVLGPKRRLFGGSAIFLRIWALTEMIPSLVNEMKPEVDIAQTMRQALTLAGCLVMTVSVVLAAAFPGLDRLYGLSPVVSVLGGVFPMWLANLFVLVFALFEIAPGK